MIRALKAGDEVTLTDQNDAPVAILMISHIFDYDKAERARQLFGIDDRNHPGIDPSWRRKAAPSETRRLEPVRKTALRADQYVAPVPSGEEIPLDRGFHHRRDPLAPEP